MTDVRCAVVLGGTSGIGLAISRQLVEARVRTLSTGRRAETTTGAAAVLGPTAVVLRSDITSQHDRDEVAGRVEADFGGIDALFINVGLGLPEAIADITTGSWDAQFDVNVRGPFFAVQSLLRFLRPGAGIVFTTLTPATASAGTAAVLAAKGAARELARALAAETAHVGLRVNSVAPGFIDTPSFASAYAADEGGTSHLEAGTALIPLGRIGRADEVARAAIFLAFDATHTTGTELTVDGGLASIDIPGTYDAPMVKK